MDRQDMQLQLLQDDLLELERSRTKMSQADRPELALAIARRIDDYLDIVEAELRSMIVMSAELALPSMVPRPSNLAMSEYHRETTQAAAKGLIPWYDKAAPSFWSLMVSSHGLDFPLSTVLLRIFVDKLSNDRHVAEMAKGPVSGLLFTQEVFAGAERPYSIDDETAFDTRFLWWHIAALSSLMDQWSLQIYDGKLPGPDSAAYYKALSFFAYELTSQHAHLEVMARGRKASKRIGANNLEPIDGSPVGRGIPFSPDTVAHTYAQVMAAAARRFELGIVTKPEWSFEFLNRPRTFRQGAYRIGRGVRQEDRTLYRISPLERTVHTAVRYISAGVAAESDLASRNGIRFAESFVKLLSPRYKPTRLWTMVLAAVHDFLLPHNEIRLQFAIELLELLSLPGQASQSSLDRLGDLLPTADTLLDTIYRDGQLDPEAAYRRFQALCLAHGISEADIWAVRNVEGKLVVADGMIRLGSVDAVAFNHDRQLRNLQQTISNCLETSILIKWIKHISKLWAQTAGEIGIPLTALETAGGLNKRNLDRMLAGMGLVKAISWAKNKAWNNPLSFTQTAKSKGAQPRRFYIRTHLKMAHGRVDIDAMQVCLILNAHGLGDVSEMNNVDLARKVMTPATVDIIKTFMDYGASDVVANLSRSAVQIQRDQAEVEIADFRRYVTDDQSLTEDQRIGMLQNFLGEIDRKYGITELVDQVDGDIISTEDPQDMEQATPEPPRPEPESYYRMANEIVNGIVSRSYRGGKFSIELSQKLLTEYMNTPIELLRDHHEAPSKAAGYIFREKGERVSTDLDFKQVVMRVWLVFLDGQIREAEQAATGPVKSPATDAIIEAMKADTPEIIAAPSEKEISFDQRKAEWHAWLWNRYGEEDEEIRVKKSPPPESDITLKDIKAKVR